MSQGYSFHWRRTGTALSEKCHQGAGNVHGAFRHWPCSTHFSYWQIRSVHGQTHVASMSLKILMRSTLSSNPNLHEDIMSTLRALPWNLKKQKTKKKKNTKVTSLHLFCCIYYRFKSLPFLWQNILYSRRRKMCDIMDFLDSYTFISHL